LSDMKHRAVSLRQLRELLVKKNLRHKNRRTRVHELVPSKNAGQEPGNRTSSSDKEQNYWKTTCRFQNE